jgi:hypothetical protein
MTRHFRAKEIGMNHTRSRRFPAALLMACSILVATAEAAPLRFNATETSSGQATLEIQSDELVTMTALPFRLLFSRTDGKPLTGAVVRCDLTMPSMPMPENRPQVTERDGAYVGEMILTCTMGDWRFLCVAEDGQGHRQTANFDIGTARMK